MWLLSLSSLRADCRRKSPSTRGYLPCHHPPCLPAYQHTCMFVYLPTSCHPVRQRARQSFRLLVDVIFWCSWTHVNAVLIYFPESQKTNQSRDLNIDIHTFKYICIHTYQHTHTSISHVPIQTVDWQKRKSWSYRSALRNVMTSRQFFLVFWKGKDAIKLRGGLGSVFCGRTMRCPLSRTASVLSLVLTLARAGVISGPAWLQREAASPEVGQESEREKGQGWVGERVMRKEGRFIAKQKEFRRRLIIGDKKKKSRLANARLINVVYFKYSKANKDQLNETVINH